MSAAELRSHQAHDDGTGQHRGREIKVIFRARIGVVQSDGR